MFLFSSFFDSSISAFVLRFLLREITFFNSFFFILSSPFILYIFLICMFSLISCLFSLYPLLFSMFKMVFLFISYIFLLFIFSSILYGFLLCIISILLLDSSSTLILLYIKILFSNSL